MAQVSPKAVGADAEIRHAEKDDQRHGKGCVDVCCGGFEAGDQTQKVGNTDEDGESGNQWEKDFRMI